MVTSKIQICFQVHKFRCEMLVCFISFQGIQFFYATLRAKHKLQVKIKSSAIRNVFSKKNQLKKSSDSILNSIASQKYGRMFEFLNFNVFFYCQIWVNCPMNDCHFNYITKEKRNIEISVSFTTKFLPIFDLKNMILRGTKDFSWKEKDPNLQDSYWREFFSIFFQIARVLW
jgi:hypothetical protein